MGQILAGVNISVEQFFGGQISFVDYLLKHDFLGTCLDVIHYLSPTNWSGGFEFFGDSHSF